MITLLSRTPTELVPWVFLKLQRISFARLLLAFLTQPLGAASTTQPAQLHVLTRRALSPAGHLFAATLQGLANRTAARVWLDADGMSAVLLRQLRDGGTTIHDVPDVWRLLDTFRRDVAGVIVCDLHTPSVNVATSLAGPMRAVALDASLLDRARAANLPILLDARGMTDAQAFDRHAPKFARGLAVEQSIRKAGHLRDYAVAHDAFTFDTTDRDFRRRVLRTLGPDPLVFGWGRDEHDWIGELSAANASAVPADWCVNLSAMEHLPAEIHRKPRPKPAPARPGERFVAFVLTDGDNVQWLTGSMPVSRRYYASPRRGTFPMTWEVSPLLARLAPRVLQYLYAHATENDGFVTGAGAPGYTFAHRQTDREALAKAAAPLLRAADLTVASAINENAGSPDEVVPLLEATGARAVLYKAFAPYHRLRGQILWHAGRPIVSYRFALWDDMKGASPAELAASVAKVTPDPKSPDAYALITVHAWSFANIGGPLEAVRQTIDRLPPNTRVVTAEDLVDLLTDNWAPATEDWDRHIAFPESPRNSFRGFPLQPRYGRVAPPYPILSARRPPRGDRRRASRALGHQRRRT